jgi:hypothetical protein
LKLDFIINEEKPVQTSWYYVLDSERVGPCSEEKLKEVFQGGAIDLESYVWKKGLSDWTQIKNLDELEHITESESVDSQEMTTPDIPIAAPSAISVKEDISWDSIDSNERIFMVKIGVDRSGNESEYGPFSINILKKSLKENRINGKTFIFTNGMDNWTFLADLPIFERVTDTLPPVITSEERRENVRRPIVARILMHDNQKLFEGICRDLSIGGVQILMADYPAKSGDRITMNIHPDNSAFSFVAIGEIVRVLGGQGGVSLRFVDLDSEAKQNIESLISKV